MTLKIKVHERVNETNISFVGKNESVCESFNPRTVQIGDEIWMSRNLTIDDGGDGIYRGNGQTYYTWEAAMRVANSIPGWHLPTATDINTLIADAGEDTSGTALKSTTGWQRNGNGTDEFGFAAYPVGYVIGSSIQEDGYNASFWSSTEKDNKWANTLMMCSQNKSARLYFGDKKYARPVRLVKD